MSLPPVSLGLQALLPYLPGSQWAMWWWVTDWILTVYYPRREGFAPPTGDLLLYLQNKSGQVGQAMGKRPRGEGPS